MVADPQFTDEQAWRHHAVILALTLNQGVQILNTEDVCHDAEIIAAYIATGKIIVKAG